MSADSEAFKILCSESLAQTDFAKDLFLDVDQKQFMQSLAKTYFTGELDRPGIIDFLADLVEEEDTRNKIADHIIAQKKKMTNKNRLADKRPPPKEPKKDEKKEEKAEKAMGEPKKKQKTESKPNSHERHVQEGDLNGEKRNLKQELENTGKTKCRFFPFCKNPETCEFFHPTEKCQYFPRCRFGENCLYIHEACKFNEKCTKMNCPYAHSNKRSANPLQAFMKSVMGMGGKNVNMMMKGQFNPNQKKKKFDQKGGEDAQGVGQGQRQGGDDGSQKQ